MHYPAILDYVTRHPWYLTPDKAEQMTAVLEGRLAGAEIPAATVAMVAAENRRAREPARAGAVAVLPVLGVLAPRMDLMMESSGGTSMDRLGRDFDALVADESVRAIVLDVDSPGGSAMGTPELADRIYAARSAKPVVAVARPEAASAAYFLAAAAGELVVTPSGWVGSIGTVAVHTDQSALNEAMGITTTYITEGKYKAEGNPDEPLGDEARDYIQGIVKAHYETFVSSVARYRGVPAAEVRAQYGQGRMLMAKDALAAGMVDRIDTLDNTIRRLTGDRRSSRSVRNMRSRLDLQRKT